MYHRTNLAYGFNPTDKPGSIMPGLGVRPVVLMALWMLLTLSCSSGGSSEPLAGSGVPPSGVPSSGCTKSGQTLTLSAGATAADVQAAIDNSDDCATLTFDAGSYSWTSDINFSMSKGVTLICAPAGNCTVTGDATLGMNGTCSGTSTKLYRVSGFVFSGESRRFWWYGPSACRLTQIRIDHNTFSGQSGGITLMNFGENSSVNNYFYGVVDHNTINYPTSIFFAELINGTNSPAKGALGSAGNLFFEDNTITITDEDNSGSGCIDGWGGHAVVWRFNTVTNCRILMHGVVHEWGPINFEVYHNTILHTPLSDLPTGYRSIHHQGSGTMMVFENVISQAPGQSHDANAMNVLHYRAFEATPDLCDGTSPNDGNRAPIGTYAGYPCKRQPGRDVDATLYPIYSWRNHWSDDGSLVRLECDGTAPSCTKHVVENRDYYNAVSKNPQTSPTSPFNGTSGMGFGLLANRPTTCMTGPEAADSGRGGVGYWATDQGEWNSNNPGADGQLYICTATNTWSLHYTPYQYPHPLQML